MATWHEYLLKEGHPPSWPYPINFGQEQVVDTDVLVIGGGIAGCWAAINAARLGVRVALVEKGDVRRSGAGGPGCDHWCNTPTNPLSRAEPDEWARHKVERPYGNGIGVQIQCRENFDTLLEMEQMGGKIRDDKDEYVGADGRDEKTKFMISPRSYKPVPNLMESPVGPDYNLPEDRNNVTIRVWGNTFKPALKKECLRLGVKVFDRVMGTSLLNENGVQGARVVGATGLNGRTGEFMIFQAKAVILSTAGSGSLWLMSMEHGGYSNMQNRNTTGDGTAMAWKAGATLTMMERTSTIGIATGLKHKWYTGSGDASYENVPIVDDNGRRIPYPTQGWEDAGGHVPPAGLEDEIRARIMTGEYALPFVGDFPSMKDIERRATWELMLKEESTTRIIVNTLNQGGFDGSRDQLFSYKFIEGQSPPQWRDAGNGGGLLIDWDLKTTVEGLYAAGSQMFSPDDHSYCAATGRYAGRKAAAYVKEVGEGKISRDQIEKEKSRVFAPTKRTSGIEWKELHNGLTRAMQYFVSEFKTERLLNMGLDEIGRLEAEAVPQLFALDPHKLMRSVEDLSMIEYAKIIINASLARKASSIPLSFNRIDYPQVDPPEWNKYLTIKLENNQVKTGELPQHFWGDMVQQYEAHNKDYKGAFHTVSRNLLPDSSKAKWWSRSAK